MYSALQYMIDQLKDDGYDMEAIFDGSGINQAALRDPWPNLSQEQYSTLTQNIYRITEDPAIGLNLNHKFRINRLGIPGFATIACDNFAQARKFFMHYRLLIDPAIYINHRVGTKDWIMELNETFPLEQRIKRFALEGHIARTLRFCEDVTHTDSGIISINLDYEPPDYEDLYHDFFPCPVNFQQPANQIIFDHSLLDMPLPMKSKEVFNLLEQATSLRFSKLDAEESLTNKVFQEIYRNHNPRTGQMLGLGEVARRLYLSPRTLRRKLLAENTSFQKVINEARKELARYYLAETALSIKEIAFALGYSSTNNFHRAFKEWTGSRISDIRSGD